MDEAVKKFKEDLACYYCKSTYMCEEVGKPSNEDCYMELDKADSFLKAHPDLALIDRKPAVPVVRDAVNNRYYRIIPLSSEEAK